MQQNQPAPMGVAEEQIVAAWWNNNGHAYLTHTAPSLINDAQPSQAVRLRWFDVNIQGTNYTIGFNIHYRNAQQAFGQPGAVWFINQNTRDFYELHPIALPQHNLSPQETHAIGQHVNNPANAALYLRIS